MGTLNLIFIQEKGCILKLLSVPSLTGSIVGLLVLASWVPSAQAAQPCATLSYDNAVRVGTDPATGTPMCVPKTPDGGGSNSGSSAEQTPAPRTPDPIESRIGTIFSIVTALHSNFAEQERIMKSPKYQAYMRGGWEFFQGKNGEQPGESCAAMFWRKDVIFIISGPGRGNKDAYLTYFGKDVPRPQSIKTVNVTLTHNNSATKTVKAFNFKSPDSSFGSIGLAVPSIEAALAGMEDTGRYDLAMDGKSVANIEWYGGLAARDRLRKCLSARVKK
jgi:hypothetical protein